MSNSLVSEAENIISSYFSGNHMVNLKQQLLFLTKTILLLLQSRRGGRGPRCPGLRLRQDCSSSRDCHGAGNRQALPMSQLLGNQQALPMSQLLGNLLFDFYLQKLCYHLSKLSYQVICWICGFKDFLQLLDHLCNLRQQVLF